MKESLRLLWLVMIASCLVCWKSAAQQDSQELQLVEAPPPFGTFYLASSTIPYPFDPSFGQLPVYEWKPGVYIVDDSQVAGSQTAEGGSMMTMESGGPVPCDPCGDPGTNTVPCITITNFSLAYQSSTGLWLTITVDTNYVGNLVVHTSDTNAAYDLFGTTNMVALSLPVLSKTNWAFLMRTTTTPTNFLWPSISTCEAYFQLGTMADPDLDGLTSAYEILVSHTSTNLFDTDNDGLSDGWELTWGLNPLVDDSAVQGSRINYTYDGAGRLTVVYGRRSENITIDPEGNIQNISQ